jgi:hypothetical protein
VSLTSLTVDHVLRDFLPPPAQPFISGIKAVRCSSAFSRKAQLVTEETLTFFFSLFRRM